jgi:hypothetical protein
MPETVDLLGFFSCSLGDEEEDDGDEEQVEDVDSQQCKPEEN